MTYCESPKYTSLNRHIRSKTDIVPCAMDTVTTCQRYGYSQATLTALGNAIPTAVSVAEVIRKISPRTTYKIGIDYQSVVGRDSIPRKVPKMTIELTFPQTQ